MRIIAISIMLIILIVRIWIKIMQMDHKYHLWIKILLITLIKLGKMKMANNNNTSILIRANKQSSRNRIIIIILWGLINISRKRILKLLSSRSSKEEPEIHQFLPISGSEFSGDVLINNIFYFFLPNFVNLQDNIFFLFFVNMRTTINLSKDNYFSWKIHKLIFICI